MEEPIWVLLEAARAIQSRQVAEHGGIVGVRDDGLLESAMARPRNLWAYGDPAPDLAALAAAYAYGLARNHPFHDGNKRVALVVCRLFLLSNGLDLAASQEEKFRTFLGLAAGDVDEPTLGAWIRGRLTNRP